MSRRAGPAGTLIGTAAIAPPADITHAQDLYGADSAYRGPRRPRTTASRAAPTAWTRPGDRMTAPPEAPCPTRGGRVHRHHHPALGARSSLGGAAGYTVRHRRHA
ncbi:hypothetical protein [Streptomyces sp. FZ201]|uniref:hypothetical protein n=1 Tax=Streptomyces sp. FZ201 TaxID=3057122 RepID=UPI0021C01A57|nr:hypothetical protein [Streptomyces sp. FZ201]